MIGAFFRLLSRLHLPPSAESGRAREGFYRGLTIAVVPALAAIVAKLIRGSASLRGGHSVHQLGTGPLVFALLIVLATIGLSFWRYRRFVEYRVRDALFGFAIDSEKPPPASG